MDFSHLLEKKVMVNFVGGREVMGTLRNFDEVSNLILEDAIEIFRDPNDIRVQISKRDLGILIVRGPNVSNTNRNFLDF
jgi:U6 snRNA-associated Sm-like protein LSm7